MLCPQRLWWLPEIPKCEPHFFNRRLLRNSDFKAGVHSCVALAAADGDRVPRMQRTSDVDVAQPDFDFCVISNGFGSAVTNRCDRFATLSLILPLQDSLARCCGPIALLLDALFASSALPSGRLIRLR